MNGKPAESTHQATARVPMLRMAKAWQATGQINQAIGAYTRLLERYPGSPEALEAADELRTLAHGYERHGQYRLAMDLYAKVEGLS